MDSYKYGKILINGKHERKRSCNEIWILKWWMHMKRLYCLSTVELYVQQDLVSEFLLNNTNSMFLVPLILSVFNNMRLNKYFELNVYDRMKKNICTTLNCSFFFEMQILRVRYSCDREMEGRWDTDTYLFKFCASINFQV